MKENKLTTSCEIHKKLMDGQTVTATIDSEKTGVVQISVTIANIEPKHASEEISCVTLGRIKKLIDTAGSVVKVALHSPDPIFKDQYLIGYIQLNNLERVSEILFKIHSGENGYDELKTLFVSIDQLV